MENVKSQKSSVIDLYNIEKFVFRISSTRETPALIQMIADNVAWMGLTRELVNSAPENEPELWQQFSRACQRKKLDAKKLKARLVPVAQSLGLTIYGNQQQDYYALLGVDSSASSDDIRKAYHRKAKSLHPDIQKNHGDDEAFIQLADGYKVLKDPVLRAHYDNSRQSTEAWCEGPVCMDDHKGQAGRKTRRNRYILQLSGVVVFMIFAALIFNMIYESNAIKDGFYVAQVDEKPEKSEKRVVENISEGDRIDDRFKKSDPKRIRSTSDLGEKGKSTFSKVADKKQGKDSIENSDLQKKKVARTDVTALSNENTDSQSNRNFVIESKEDMVIIGDEKPQIKKGESFQNKQKNTNYATNTKKAFTTKKRDVTLPIQDDFKVNVGKKAANDQVSPPREKKEAKDNLVKFNRKQAADESDQDSTLEASALLRKYSEEERGIKRVSAFILKYSQTYEKKDYSKFSRLFTKDATENGKVFSELAPDYRRIFTVLENLEYKIELYRTSFIIDQNIIRTEGIYKIAWRPYDGFRKEIEGNISFEIVKRNGKYLVNKLNYNQTKPP